MRSPDYSIGLFRLLPSIIENSLKMNLDTPYSDWVLRDRKYAKKLDESDYAVILLIDALAVYQLHGKIRELWQESGSLKLNSVIPTSTGNAIASFYIGLPPEFHGVIATKFYLPEIGNFIDALTGKVPGVGFRDALSAVGIRLSSFLWNPPVYHNIPQDKMVLVDLYPKHLEGGLRHFYEENTLGVPYATLSDMIYSIPEIIKQLHARNRKGIIVSYSADIDSVGHMYGNTRPLELIIRIHNLIVEELIELLRSTAKELGVKIKLVITSDHGQIDIKKNIKIPEEKLNELQDKGIIIQQSGRFAFVYVDKEEKIDDARESLVNILGEDADVLTLNEAIRARLWPALTDEKHEAFTARAGQLVILPKKHIDISKERKREKEELLQDVGYYAREFRGSHGGATREEIETPLIILDIP